MRSHGKITKHMRKEATMREKAETTNKMRHLPPADIGIFIQRICLNVFKIFKEREDVKHGQEIKDKWETRNILIFQVQWVS